MSGLRNDCFALPPGVDWIPVAEALGYLRTGLDTVVKSENIDVNQSLGRVLSADVMARANHPAFANSAVDGYAIRGEGVDFKIKKERAAAGEPFTGAVATGEALRILTGANVPDDIDRIILEEDVEIVNGAFTLAAPAKKGANIRPQAEDIAAGTPVLAAGHRISARDLAVLAAAGVETVAVYAPLRVGIASTGDEINGQNNGVPDANRPLLLAQMRAWGFTPVDLGILPDDPEAIRQGLDFATKNCDALLTTGGASAGDEDHMSRILGAEGHRAIWRVAIKPGRPLALGTWSGLPVFALPGNPVAAFTCAFIFARPALGLLAGEGWWQPYPVRVPAAFAKQKKQGRSEYLRARLTPDGHAEIFKSEGSGRVSGLSWSTGFVALDAAARTISEGDYVDYIPYSAFDSAPPA